MGEPDEEGPTRHAAVDPRLKDQGRSRRSVEVGLEVSRVSELLEHSSNVRRMATQLAKGTNLLNNLYRQINLQAQQRAQHDVLHEELTD